MKQRQYTSNEDRYKIRENPCNDKDLAFFNRAGKHDVNGEENKFDYLDDNVSGWFYEQKIDDEVEINGQKVKLKNYAIDCDSAVRLDSALLYHYWEKLESNDDKFSKDTRQTYVLTHADLKAPVDKTRDEICKDPDPESWQYRMLTRILKDNEALMKFVSDTIGGNK